MGTIISSIAELDSIRWTELKKGKVRKVRRALLLTDHAAILELETGEFTVVGTRHAPNGNWAVVGYGLERFTGGVLDGLVKLGILTRKHVDDHLSSAKARARLSDRKYARRSLEDACKTLGIPVPEVPND